MKILLIILLGVNMVQAFVSPSQNTHTSGQQLAGSASPDAFTKPERLVLQQLPTLYLYDHCPYCVRVRLALGLKNIKHNLRFLANDDIPTPTGLVGKKIVPILECPESNVIMTESMDIVHFLDSEEKYGPVHVLKPASERTDLNEWQSSVRDLLRTLQRPRYVATGLLPEFQQLDGRHAYIRSHQLPPYDKAEWDAMDNTEKCRIYAEAMSSDPVSMIEELNAKLVQLDDIICSEHFCTEGGLSMDDIDLWGRLRSITIIKGVQWPERLRRYMDTLSALADVALYDELAM